MTPDAQPTALSQLRLLQDALDRLRQAEQNDNCAHALSASARQHHILLAALPPRYTEVLLGLLDRLESSALFTDESCSFSQKDLVANLQLWVDKARDVLAVGA